MPAREASAAIAAEVAKGAGLCNLVGQLRGGVGFRDARFTPDVVPCDEGGILRRFAVIEVLFVVLSPLA